jgi:putative phage-type endonuclease
MKIIDVEQGSAEWHAARCGRVTASRIADIVRKTKTGISKMRQTYAGELIAERLSGVQESSFTSPAMQWGKETEAKARATYAFMHDAEVMKVGLVVHPKIDMAAASPDSLVGQDGMLEVKCPQSATHIATLLGAEIDPDYYKQMQWGLACTERQWCDFVSFDPRMPGHMALYTQRIVRDQALIDELTAAVIAFLGEVDKTIAALAAKYPEPKSVAA